MWKDIEFITQIIKNSINKTDILNKLGLKNNGGNYNTLSHFINDNKIDISHFINGKSPNRLIIKIEISDILVRNSSYKSSSNLKKRLYAEGLKQRNCEICSQTEYWNGRKMSLILDHINGDRHDNRIENLRIVCPNCNATLETHCRGLNTNGRGGGKKCDNENCNNRIRLKSKTCISCYSNNRKRIEKIEKEKKKTRKVERPEYETLVSEVIEYGYCWVGRKYGVSDNAVRKWIKNYIKNEGKENILKLYIGE